MISASALEDWNGDSGAATGDGVNDFAGGVETSSSELGGRTRHQIELAHTSLHLVFGMETCIQIVQVLQSRGWLRSVHDNMGVDGDGLVQFDMIHA